MENVVIAGLAEHFRGRRVLVTGHTGFKGGWLAFWLAEMGARVTGFALPPEPAGSFFDCVGLGKRVEHVEGDLRDAGRVSEAVARARPEIVLHLAAQSLVRRSYVQPLRTFATNVTGTAALLDAVRALDGPCSVIVATSDKCYENRETGRPFVEADRLGGRDPYSASKAGTELVVAAYRSSFFEPAGADEPAVSLATVRAGNVIGGGDWAEDRILCDVVRALSAGRPIPVRNPDAVRPWQHVFDALSGYLMLAARMQAAPGHEWNTAWNFGPLGQGTLTVRQLVEEALTCWGTGSWQDQSTSPAPHEARHLSLDASKANRVLGWRPVWNARQAVALTIEWYKAHGDGTDMASFSLEQLQRYEQGAAGADRLASRP